MITDPEILICRMKEALDRADDASDSDESVCTAPTNRYCKLKRKARFVGRGKLDVAYGTRADTKYKFYGAKKRAIIHRRHHNAASVDDAGGVGDEGSESSDPEDPYHGIKIEEILAPINHPSELPRHPAYSKTFRRGALPVLANHALEAISTEHAHRVQLSRLLTAFLGDDPGLVMNRYNVDSGIHLVQHHGGVGGTVALSGEMNGARTSQNGSGGANGVEKGTGEEAIGPETSTNTATKPMTRHGAALEESQALLNDFISPIYDRDLGIAYEEAEETRRLLQAALDRSEEYLRCMDRVRSGLIKADRYRNKIYRFCKDSDSRGASIEAGSERLQIHRENRVFHC